MTPENKDYYDLGVKKGRAEGRRDAKKELERRIGFIYKSNRRLFDELLRLDRDEPVSCVYVTYEMAERIARLLKKHRCYGSAKYMRECIANSNPIDPAIVIEIMEEIKKG